MRLAIVVAVLAAAALGGTAHAAPPPLVAADPGFEDGGAAWTFAGGGQVSTAAPKTGTQHAALAAGGATVTQSITAPATGSYDLSAWAHATGGPADGMISVRVNGRPAASAPVRVEPEFYTRHTLPHIAVREGDAVEVAARSGSGELHVDDFSFARSAPANPVARSSNEKVVELFDWAKVKANSWVHQPGVRGPVNVDERNPVGTGQATYAATYWAGYAHRTGYYGRDFAHQAAGAHLLGLDDETKTMLRSFATSATEEHKYYPVWAINFDAATYLSIDYRGPTRFVREVPTPFELVEKANAAYRWTGDDDYVRDPLLWSFYRRTTDDFIALHDPLRPNGVAEGTGGGIFEGVASYNEQSDEPLSEAGDGIGSQYQAFRAMAALASDRHDNGLARRFRHRARALKRYFNETWSRTEDPSAFVRAYDVAGNPITGWGKENSWFMPMKRIVDAGRRNDAYLDFIDAQATDPVQAPRNIEAISYLPDTFFANDRAETAWKWMQHVYDSRETRHVNTRQGLNGDYPEIPFTLLSQTVEGLMGVQPDAPRSAIATLSRLAADIGWLEVSDIPFGAGTVTLRHDGTSRSTLTNRAGGRALRWQARFPGRHRRATVNGAPAAVRRAEIDGVTYTVVERRVPPGRTVTVEVS
jgi:hypothetical protein